MRLTAVFHLQIHTYAHTIYIRANRIGGISDTVSTAKNVAKDYMGLGKDTKAQKDSGVAEGKGGPFLRLVKALAPALAETLDFLGQGRHAFLFSCALSTRQAHQHAHRACAIQASTSK